MSQEIQKTINEVQEAIHRLNTAFENHVKTLQQEADPDHLQQWVKATQAMQDSGQIYLTWARHYGSLSSAVLEDDSPISNEGYGLEA